MKNNDGLINGWRSAVQGWYDFERGGKRTGLVAQGYSAAQAGDSDHFELCAYGCVERGLTAAFVYSSHRRMAREMLTDVVAFGISPDDAERFGEGWSHLVNDTITECAKFISIEVDKFNRGKNPK